METEEKKAATAVAFDENGGAKNILTAWKSLYDKGFAPNVGKGGDAGLADFSAGKSAITLGSTASLKQILQDVNGKFEVGTAYFPKIKSSDEGGVSIGGASLWALNNDDPKKTRATWEFVKFLISRNLRHTGMHRPVTSCYNSGSGRAGV